MPKRPPKEWWNRCTAGVAESNRLYDRDADPSSVCGSLWYHKMRPADKRLIVQKAEAKKMKKNPVSLRIREGTRVQFKPTPASLALYTRPPKSGALGTVKPVNLGGGKHKTSLAGPGGGLVYVKWDDGYFQGVSSLDLVKMPRAHKRVAERGLDYDVTGGEKLEENPAGGGMLVLAALAAAGVAWLLLRKPSSAAAPASSPQLPAPTEPSAVPSILPPAKSPVSVPNLPATNCGSKIYVTYKFTGKPLLINVFRRLTVWDTKVGLTNTQVVESGRWADPKESSFLVSPQAGDFEEKLKDAGVIGMPLPSSSSIRYLAEAWVQTIDGWCLAETSTNYEPWTVSTASPSSVVSPPAPPAPNSLTQQASLEPATPELGRRGGGGTQPHISPPPTHLRQGGSGSHVGPGK